MAIIVPLRRLLPAVALVLLSACGTAPTAGPPSPGGPNQTAQVTESMPPAAAAASVAASAAASTLAPASAASCTMSGPASSSWLPAPSMPVTGPPPIVSAAVAGDTFTLMFLQGTPAFEVRTQSNARFSRDPSGLPVTLAGSAGARIALSGFRGDRPNFTGQLMGSGGPVLLQVQGIGDFEGVVSWAVGLSRPACASVTASGSTLTFLFIPLNGKG